MTLTRLHNFDRVPDSPKDVTEMVYTAQVVAYSTGLHIEEGCIVTKTLSDCHRFFGSGNYAVTRVFIPTSIPLFWRKTEQGTYAEVGGLPNGRLRVNG